MDSRLRGNDEMWKNLAHNREMKNSVNQCKSVSEKNMIAAPPRRVNQCREKNIYRKNFS